MKYLDYFLWFIISITSIYNLKIEFDNEILGSYHKREFIIFKNPPFSSILEFLISKSFSNTRCISYVFFFIKSLLFLSTDLDITLSSIIFTIPDFNPSYAAIFALLSLNAKNIFVESIFIGLSVVSDLSAVFLLILLILKNIFNLFYDLVDKKKTVKDTSMYFLLRLSLNISVPGLIYFSTFYVDYHLRDTLRNYRDISLEFSSAFKDLSLQPTHDTVVSGSLISIISRHHKYFLGVNSMKVVGIQRLNSDCVWQINKVEGGGVIKNNDLVRLLNVKTNRVLALNHVNNTDKFFDLEISKLNNVSESKNEVFRVLCKDILLTRRSLLELQNTNTGIFLGMRKINENDTEYINAYTSIYSNKKHRLFYVSDNDSGTEYPKEIINYPQLGFFSRVHENTKIILKKSTNFSSKSFHNNVHNLLIPAVPLFLLINLICKNRSLKYKEVDQLLLIMYINSLLLKFVYCNDLNYLSVSEVITNYYFFKMISRKMIYIYLSVGLGFILAINKK
ncbi:hypothetical protein P3W45_000745 [Vairimorpha bombi]|jgi:hypothetical protein